MQISSIVFSGIAFLLIQNHSVFAMPTPAPDGVAQIASAPQGLVKRLTCQIGDTLCNWHVSADMKARPTTTSYTNSLIFLVLVNRKAWS